MKKNRWDSNKARKLEKIIRWKKAIICQLDSRCSPQGEIQKNYLKDLKDIQKWEGFLDVLFTTHLDVISNLPVFLHIFGFQGFLDCFETFFLHWYFAWLDIWIYTVHNSSH